jgi:hypothetical protein
MPPDSCPVLRSNAATLPCAPADSPIRFTKDTNPRAAGVVGFMAASGLNYEAEVFAAGKDWQRAIAGWVLHLGACALDTRHGRSLLALIPQG